MALTTTPTVTVAQDERDAALWICECGREFILTEGGPADNDINYCPHCGGKVEEQRTLTEAEQRWNAAELMADAARDIA